MEGVKAKRKEANHRYRLNNEEQNSGARQRAKNAMEIKTEVQQGQRSI